MNATDTKLPPFPTREEFRAWLVSKAGEAMTGHCNQPGVCPIKAYLRDAHPGESFGVSSSHWGFDDGSGMMPLPPWAFEFVTAVDRRTSWVRDSLRAETVLKILDTVETDA